MGKIILLVSAICLVTSGLFAQKIQDGFENLSTIIAPDMLYFSDIEDDHRTSWNTEAGTVFGVKHKVRPYFGTSCELRLGKSQKLTMLGALRMFSNFSSDLSVGLHAQLGKVNLGGGLFSRSLSTNDSKPSRVGLALNLGYRSEKIGDKHFIDIQTQTNLGLKHEGLVFLQKKLVGLQTNASIRHMMLIPTLDEWVGYYGLLVTSSSIGMTGGLKNHINDFALSYQFNYNINQHLVTLSCNWSGINSLKWFSGFGVLDLESNPKKGAKEKRESR